MLTPTAYIKGALRRLFCCLACGLLLAAWHTPLLAQDADCPPQRIDEQALVKRVFDGDTLLLDDGRKVRLIGIDTPELGREQRPAQPYAQQARQALTQLIDDLQGRVALQHGVERHDRYRRLLAHVFSPAGDNINAELLRRGLAVAYTTPPNDRLSACYHRLDREAAIAGTGLWQHPRYAVVDATALLDSGEGFRRIAATIRRVQHKRSGIWLHAGALSIHIRPHDTSNFDNDWLHSLQGRRIIVRGWLRKDRYRPDSRRYLQLRHPSAIDAPSSTSRS